jgi:hypothetical protein
MPTVRKDAAVVIFLLSMKEYSVHAVREDSMFHLGPAGTRMNQKGYRTIY